MTQDLCVVIFDTQILGPFMSHLHIEEVVGQTFRNVWT